MASLSELKKSRKNSLDSLRKKAEESKSGGGGYTDDRFWKPEFDKEKGFGRAKVRFLPAPPGEELPWVKIFRHFFRGPTGKVYVENSLTTIGQSDPVSHSGFCA